MGHYLEVFTCRTCKMLVKGVVTEETTKIRFKSCFSPPFAQCIKRNLKRLVKDLEFGA